MNCGNSVESNYCPDCGQKTKVLPITWKGLLSELSSRWLGLDNRLFRTFKGLWIRPHVVVEEYLEGNRVKYIGPLSYLVVMSALYIFSFSIFGVTTEEFLRVTAEGFQPAEQTQTQQEFMATYSQRISQNMRLMVASMIPFMSLSLIIFYKRRNFLENFLIISYATSQMLWLSILTLAIFATTGYLEMTFSFILNIGYFAWLIGKLNPQKGKFWTYFKPLIVWIVGYIFFMLSIGFITIIGLIAAIATGQVTLPQ